MGGRRIGAFAVVLALVTGVVGVDQGVSLAQSPGSNLTHEVTATDPGEGGQIRLEDISAFAPSGGQAIFEPGTSAEERFTYAGTDGADQLVGISRANPTSHPEGSFVGAVQPAESSPTPSGEPTPTASPTPTTSSTTEPTSAESTNPYSPEATEPVSGPASTADSTSSSGSMSTAGAVGDVPEICEMLDCSITVGPAVQQILDMVETRCPNLECTDAVIGDVGAIIGGLCGGGVNYCAKEVEELASNLIAQLCQYGDCVGAVEALVTDAVDSVMSIICPSGSIGYCVSGIQQEVDAQVAWLSGLVLGAVAGVCPSGVATCADPVVDYVFELYDGAFRVVCPSGSIGYCASQQQEQVNGYITYVSGLITQAVGDLCPSGLANCADSTVDYVLELYDAAFRVVCPSGSVGYCASQIQEQLNGYVIYVNGLLTQAVGNLCPTGLSTCADPTIAEVMRIYDTAYRIVCPSGSAGYCLSQLQYQLDQQIATLTALVNSTANNLKKMVCPPYGDVTTCANDEVAYVMSLYDMVFKMVCPSGSVGYCVSQTQYEIDRQIAALTALVNSTLATVKKAACPPYGDVATCANDELAYVQAVVWQSFNTAYRLVCPTDSTSDACVNRYSSFVIGVVNGTADTVYRAVCGTSTSSGCVKEYETKVTAAINQLLNSVCTSTTSSGAQACVDMVTVIAKGAVDKAYRTACPTDSTSDACVNRYTSTVIGIVNGAINTIYTAVCGSSTSSTCLSNYQTKVTTLVNTTLDQMCNGVGSGASRCVDYANKLAASTIMTAYRVACPTDTTSDACVDRYSSTVVGIVTGTAEALQEAICGTSPTQDCVDGQVDGLRQVVSGLVDAHCPNLTCPSTLLAGLTEAVEEALNDACPLGLTNCVDPLVDVILGVAGDLLEDHCPLLECPDYVAAQIGHLAGELLAAAGEELAVLCPLGIQTCPGSYLDSVRATIDGLIAIHCPGLECGQETTTSLLILLSSAADAACPDGLLGCEAEVRQLLRDRVYDLCSGCVVAEPPTLPECPAGAPPYNAADIPSVIPAECRLTGVDILDGDVGASVPLPGHAVSAYLHFSLQTFRIRVEADGTVYLVDVGNEDEGSSGGTDPAPAPSPSPSPSSTSRPAAPGGLTAAATSTGISLSWRDNSDNEDSFRLERATNSSGPFSVIATLGAGTTGYSDSDLASSTTYYYRIAASNSAGPSAYSNLASATTTASAPPGSAPSSPSGLTAQSSGASVALQWLDNANDERGFRVERAPAGGGYMEVAVLAANATSFQDSSVSEGSTYYYRVRSYNDWGTSSYSNEVSVMAGGSSPSPSPTPMPSPSETWRDTEPYEYDDTAPTFGTLYTNACEDPAYKRDLYDTRDGTRYFERMDGTIRWYLNRQSIPDYMDKDRTLERLKQGGFNVTRTNTDCSGFGDVVPDRIKFDYAGVDNNESIDYSKDDKFCPGADGTSIVNFGAYDRGGVTCDYESRREGRYYITTEADIKFRRYPQGEGTHWWTVSGLPDACESDGPLYDLESTATHERGHNVGIDHVEPLDEHQTLTMSRYPDNCDRERRTLAKGDIRGLQRIFGT